MTTGTRLEDLAARVGGRVVGDPERRVRGLATLEAAGPEDLSLFTHPRYREAAAASRAGAVLVGLGTELPGRDLLEVREPYVALAELLEHFYPQPRRSPGVHPDARVAESCRIGEGVAVGPFAVVENGAVLGRRVAVGAGCVIGEGSRVGDDSVLMPRVVLYPGTEVGARCLIHAGVVLGADGFGFATTLGSHRKIPQVGRVVVGDDVEIGANTTVDRATLGETVIGAGTKIDDLVMVAHGVRLGPGCLLAAQTGIAGSTRVGGGTIFAGQSGVSGHLELGERSVVAAKSAVLQDLAPTSFVAGIPAVPHGTWKRAQAMFARLPELGSRLRRMERRLLALETRAGSPPVPDRAGED
jgi:UDP-3-O-[3-hydroxymyristoyl] glucosamine N-acyltransferase